MFTIVYLTLSLALSVHTSTHRHASSSGCSNNNPPHPQPPGSTTTLTIHSAAAGGLRTLLLHLPPSYHPNKPAPLILSFHGKGQTASTMELQTQLSNPLSNPNAIVAYPSGLDAQWTGDPAAPHTSEVNDIDFASDILDEIERSYCVDTSRVYASGFSNGGGLTGLLACSPSVSRRLAAVAIASGAFYKDSALREPLFSDCRPSHVLPVMEFHGSDDPVEHYDGEGTPDGEGYAITEWLDGWVRRNGCGEDEGKETTVLYEGKVERLSWKGGGSGGGEERVVHYYIHGFGHGWPSTVAQEDDDQRYGPACFNATEVVMEFFGKHRLDVDSGDGRRRDEL